MGPIPKLMFIGSWIFVFLSIKQIHYCLALRSTDEFLETVLFQNQNCQENKLTIEEKARNLTEMPEFERRNILCNEEILLPEKIRKQLKCRYVNREIPFLKIAPFKEEEVFLDPRILIFHDAIYDKEIEIIKNLAKPKFAEAGYLNQTTNQIEVNTQLRKTMSGWLEDCEHECLEKVSLRVQQLTNLAVDSAEPLQVAYYDIGGHYMPHYDFVIEEHLHLIEHLGTGNRIATVLFYLNDVEKGGHTVFTEINVSVKPKKGSAVFWYNLQSNGKEDFRTRHSACPVISGVKWAANKWLHVFGQEFYRPCSWNNETVILN